MAEKKKQHFIPKTYLKRFSDDGKFFSIMNVKENKVIEKVPLSKQCQKDYYYGTNLEWETRFGKLEKNWADIFMKVSENSYLQETDIKLLKQFAVYQRQRTLAEGNYRKEERIALMKEYLRLQLVHDNIPYDENEVEKVCRKMAEEKEIQSEILEWADDAVGLVDDLRLVIVEYKTKNKLISSDAPIILLNQFVPRSVGYISMGLLIIFPITNNKLVVIYDDGMYSQITTGQYAESSDEEEVVQLNIMQYLSSENIIYGNNKENFDFVNKEIIEKRNLNRNKNPLATLGPDEHKLLIISNRRVSHTCELSFARMSHNIRKIPSACREAAPRFWDEGWYNKLHSKDKIIPEIMKNHSSRDKNVEMSIKEQKRGYRLMAKFADIYWQKKRRNAM